MPAVPPELQPFLDRPDRAGVLTDFDGTLSPIVDDPAQAEPVPGAVEALAALADRYALVGVVSGRPVSYLRGHLGDRLWLSGLYGMEVVSRGERVEAEGSAAWRPAVDATVERARAELGFGDLVEHKGLSATIHFRTVPEREQEVRTWADAEADRSGLVVRPAKASLELHPPVPADKGTVVEAAAAGLDAVCFIGDDVGDLPAWDALDRLAAAGVHTVRIGVRSPEAPARLIGRADLLVDGPDGALELLRSLLDG